MPIRCVKVCAATRAPISTLHYALPSLPRKKLVLKEHLADIFLCGECGCLQLLAGRRWQEGTVSWPVLLS